MEGETLVKVDLTQVQFPDGAEQEYLEAREQKKAQLSVQGITEENIKRLVPDKPWDTVRICIDLLQNAVEAYYHRKYFSKERQIVVAPAVIRDKKAFLFRKMNKTGQFEITIAELQLLKDALDADDLQAMDGFSYVAEYIQKLDDELSAA